MIIENILREYPDIPEKIQGLNKELNDYLQYKLQTRNTLKATVITGMPFGTETTDPTGNAVVKIIDTYDNHIQYLSNEINYWIDVQQAIDRAVRQLSVEEYRIVELRYFNGYKMKRIQYMMHYGKTRVYEIHDDAIRKLNLNIILKIA